jgi:transcriptional regulator with XRE-family HTH domain
MTTVDRVKALCKENKIAISKLERDLGFANGYIGQLRKGTFPDDRLRKIADYFNVSVNYLLGIPSTGNIDMIEQVHGEDVAKAYANGGYIAFRESVEAKQKKPAPVAESELSDLQKQAVQFVMSLSNEELEQFIRIGKALKKE